MRIPSYTDGMFDLYEIKTDTTTDYPEKYITSAKMQLWFRELAIYDKTRLAFDGTGREITFKLRIPRYKKITANHVCLIEGEQHKVFNVAHIFDKDGFPETELTLVRPAEGDFEIR